MSDSYLESLSKATERTYCPSANPVTLNHPVPLTTVTDLLI